jgi:hypothetical protein
MKNILITVSDEEHLELRKLFIKELSEHLEQKMSMSSFVSRIIKYYINLNKLDIEKSKTSDVQDNLLPDNSTSSLSEDKSNGEDKSVDSYFGIPSEDMFKW